MHLFKVIHTNTTTNDSHEYDSIGKAIEEGISRYRIRQCLKSQDMTISFKDSIKMTHTIQLIPNQEYCRMENGIWKIRGIDHSSMGYPSKW